ncbi:MAG: hypothetical protein AKCLJLPJ_01163 [Fimbriimonadales bacterium]|nr:MAG: exosortase-associated EpsI family protein [Armatimonadota bacterium]MBV6503100.1 hypothetical protein [Fimbriimonadales bacterium]MCE7900849.1 exosortase-associated EpsI family protein [Armatimonadetes bacterium ATM1]MDL1929699.1 exosortase-associated EpsI family protein [Fimbriimonadia bacterium ATM]MBC6970538.1 exosortase-associated EpsI family protein [Armatimonadota bacterium]
MKSRLSIVLILFFAVGAVTTVLPRTVYPEKEESWMEKILPVELDGYSFTNSVKMEASTYETLQPFGIVGRMYQGGDGRYFEYTIVAGNTRKSFHDPQVCFSAQGWQLINPRRRDVNIPSMGGKVPATVMGLKRSDNMQGVALYFYKGPNGLRHDPFYIPIDMTFSKLVGRENIDAQFYRFLVFPASERLEDDIQDLERFAESVLSAAGTKEGGDYFLARR